MRKRSNKRYGKNQGLFRPAKHEWLADAISIKTPSSFRESIRKLQKSGGGLSLLEYRALKMAQNRAKAMLNRKNLSSEERKQLREISKIRIPDWKRY